MPFSPAAASRKPPRVIGVDYAGVLQRDGWQSYRQFHARAASDLSRASAAPLSRSCCSTIRSSRLSPRSKRSCRPRSPRGMRYHAGTISDARPRRRARAAISSGSAACSRARRVDTLPRATVSGRTSSSSLTRSSASSLIRRSMPPIGAPNTRCAPPSSLGRCVAAATAPPAARRPQQVLASVLRTAHQRGLDTTDLLVHAASRPDAHRPRRVAATSCGTLTR